MSATYGRGTKCVCNSATVTPDTEWRRRRPRARPRAGGAFPRPRGWPAAAKAPAGGPPRRPGRPQSVVASPPRRTATREGRFVKDLRRPRLPGRCAAAARSAPEGPLAADGGVAVRRCAPGRCVPRLGPAPRARWSGKSSAGARGPSSTRCRDPRRPSFEAAKVAELVVNSVPAADPVNGHSNFPHLRSLKIPPPLVYKAMR